MCQIDDIQMEKETRINHKFNVLTDQLAAVVSFLKTSQIPQNSSPTSTAQPNPQK